MSKMDQVPLGRLVLPEIERVVFYKRDEITTDLICCDVTVGSAVWTFHEEMADWPMLLERLERLPGFRTDWFAAVAQPPFALSETIAFSRVQG